MKREELLEYVKQTVHEIEPDADIRDHRGSFSTCITESDSRLAMINSCILRA